jgi:hypothetical protein
MPMLPGSGVSPLNSPIFPLQGGGKGVVDPNATLLTNSLQGEFTCYETTTSCA